MTTIALNNWNFFAAATDAASDDDKTTDEQITQISTKQPSQNPPDLGINVSDETNATEALS